MMILFAQKKDCCGCSACKNICPSNAITMEPDEEGFLYPNINHLICKECGLCIQVCAFQNGYDTSKNIDIPEVYAVKHMSDEVRQNSTSGGAFTAISDYILSHHGVIYGAGFDEAFRVYHQRAETSSDRDHFRGSKYVQSDLGTVFSQVKEDLQNNRRVLFTGTPCQVAGLYTYLGKAKVNLSYLLTIDFICRGTPSPKVFADHISFLEKKNKNKIVHYAFRSKVLGWGRHTEEIVFRNRKVDYTSLSSQLYKYLFHSRLCLRPSCHHCRYTNTNRPGDITIGDYWGIDKIFPAFNDVLGVSVMINNTEKGKAVYTDILDNIESIPSNLKDCAFKQESLRMPAPENPRRKAFWDDYLSRGYKYVLNKYTKYGKRNTPKKIIKRILRKLNILETVSSAHQK